MKRVWKLMIIGAMFSTTVWAASIAVCKGCHGQHWEKVVMRKSKIVKNMSKTEILKALKGYKDGTYGGSLKGLMQKQVKDLSEEEMKAIVAKIKK
jgi:cytochrome c-type protein NapB